MEKIIHYCWFGGAPLPKLVKKCIDSWKKYLPDYEIKEWNETNFDVNQCPFIKEAYEKKKWAFVSDYARITALYEYGGIYLDTDMKIIKDISFALQDDVFMGYEDSGYFGTAIIGVKEKHSKYLKPILDFYHNQQHFYENNIYDYANPIILTNEFKKYPMKKNEKGVEIYDEKIHIYPRDYFFPISYDYSEKLYTDNTCAIHFFSGTWTDKNERRTIMIYRKLGVKWGKRVVRFLAFLSTMKHRMIDMFGRWFRYWAMKYSIHINRNKRVARVKKELEGLKENYVVIHHPEWMGVTNATQDVFKSSIALREQHTEKEAKMMAEAILETGKKMVIFNAFAYGWQYLAREIKLKDPTVIVKVLLHGSNALLSEPYDWDVLNIILDSYDKKWIDEIGFVKKSLYEFYKAKGYRVSFVMNNVNIDNKEKYQEEKKEHKGIKVGLYASGDRWVKNTYNQISAISLIENATLDCIPINYKISTLARRYHLNLSGEERNIPREELYKRLAANDINVYVTFTECSPLIPLESLELGTPCITGDNHHYFEGTELEKYLVVNKEDNIMEIAKQIEFCLENKEKVLELYQEWKKEYCKQAKESAENFLKIEE